MAALKRVLLAAVLVLSAPVNVSAFFAPHSTSVSRTWARTGYQSRGSVEESSAAAIQTTSLRAHSTKNGASFATAIKEHNKAVRSLAAGIIFSFALIASPTVGPAHQDWFAANAQEGEQQSLLTSPTTQEKKDLSVVEEVWTLIDKFYIDRSFNGQDWKAVKQDYLTQEQKAGDSDEKSMQLVTKMAKSLGDKYSRVLDVQSYEAIQKYDLIGVGVTLMPNQQKQIIVGAPPVAKSVADKAGMKVGDYVVAVNGVATEGRTAFDLIDQISENPTAKTVTMTVRTQGPNDLANEGFTRDLTMERAFAEVRDPIEYRVSETRKDGTKVGYIRIAEFNSIVKGKLEAAAIDLEKQGVNAYVLDVRGNPGGAFQSAVEISSLFLDNRVATYVLDSNQVELPFKTSAGRVIVDPEDPLVIWVDRHSASASEVLTGSLHDNCRAIVMGENSFGKGLVQAVYGLKNGAGFVLTVAKYVTPSGTDIQGKGIVPDIEVGLPPSLIPVISGDTSKVDFTDISKRLSLCTVPTTH